MPPDDPRAAAGEPAGPRRELSLRARALNLLAMREHSGVELRRKLAPDAESAEQLEDLLAELAAQGLFSEERFAESLVRRRAQRYGMRRIAVELEGHRLGARSADALRGLAETEFDRALEVWRRRFGVPPSDFRERARQHRFLLQRGFDADTIRQVLHHAEARSTEPGPPS